jgi:hypothetical protein
MEAEYQGGAKNYSRAHIIHPSMLAENVIILSFKQT